MRKHWVIFKEILKNENKFSSNQIHTVPIDIENTELGTNMQCLLDTISGNDAISPYKDVSFRVITRMADLLQARSYDQNFIDTNDRETLEKVNDEDLDPEDRGIKGAIFNCQRETYAKRISLEADFWYDKPQFFFRDLGKQQE